MHVQRTNYPFFPLLFVVLYGYLWINVRSRDRRWEITKRGLHYSVECRIDPNMFIIRNMHCIRWSSVKKNYRTYFISIRCMKIGEFEIAHEIDSNHSTRPFSEIDKTIEVIDSKKLRFIFTFILIAFNLKFAEKKHCQIDIYKASSLWKLVVFHTHYNISNTHTTFFVFA